MAFSIQMCDLQVLLTSISTCFLCVCMLCCTTVPMLHITCWAAWECGALWMTSSCSDRPHYRGVGTSKIPLIILEEDMLSLLFIYGLFSWPCFFFKHFLFLSLLSYNRGCFPWTCRQSSLWGDVTISEKLTRMWLGLSVFISWQTSCTYISSQTYAKYLVETLNNRKWLVWVWLHNLQILCQDHGKRMFITICYHLTFTWTWRIGVLFVFL